MNGGKNKEIQTSNNQTNQTQQDGEDNEPIPNSIRLIITALFFVAIIVLSIWNKLPGQAKSKWIFVGVSIFAIACICCWIWIFSQSRKKNFFKVLNYSIVVVLIVFGAIISSLLFAVEFQSQIFKIFAVLYFAILPPWLYLLFFSTKGKTLWDEYVLNLFRLHADHYTSLPEPPKYSSFYKKWSNEREKAERKSSTDPSENLYQKKFQGFFGYVGSDEGVKIAVFSRENLWPVALATLLISVGWAMVVQPGTFFNFSILPQSFKSSGSPQVPLETLRFAFLGSYFYILQMLVRRYFQNDLKTSAYINSIMRIIVVVLLSWIIDLVVKDQISQTRRSMLAFIIGVFPQIGWQTLQSLIKVPFKVAISNLTPKYPLSELDGMNIWYESRLLEEGIEDMQNLATANLVDVMLHTRIPVERLVDWLDQSLLYLRVNNEKIKGGQSKRNESERNESDREKLRRFGIRTATDLEEAFDPSSYIGDGSNNSQNNHYDAGEFKEHLNGLKKILNSGKDEKETSVLLSILATLQNEPNLYHIKEWKTFTKGLSHEQNDEV